MVLLPTQWMISDHSKYCILNQVVLKLLLCVKKKSLLYWQVKKSILWTPKTQGKKNAWSVSIHIYQKILWLINNLTDLLKRYSHLATYGTSWSKDPPRFSQNEQPARWRTAEKIFFVSVTEESVWWLRQWNPTCIILAIFQATGKTTRLLKNIIFWMLWI